MKYIINENRLEELIYNYIEKMYDVDDINFTNPYKYDDAGNEYEEPNIIEYYSGDYEGSYDTKFLFVWVDPDYYNEDYIGLKRKCPILEINDEEGAILDNYFNNNWHEPFKLWFENNFRLPVKTINVGITH